jgi:predicted nucleic acid-binding protein
MKLEEVPNGTRVYIDANIFIYHFTRLSSECRAFLARCESGEVQAFTGTHVVLEVLHRLMMLEALHKGLLVGGQPARKLKEHPEIVRNLHDYNQSVRQIPRMGVSIRAVTPALITASAAIRVQYGILTNDSVSVAVMWKLGLTHLVSHDSDLRSVAGLVVYQPGDLT